MATTGVASSGKKEEEEDKRFYNESEQDYRDVCYSVSET